MCLVMGAGAMKAREVVDLLEGELLVFSECNLGPPEGQDLFLPCEASLQP